MKVVVLYRPKSEFATATEEYAREFNRRTGKTLELLDYDSPKGLELAQVYDITSQPAILALKDDGALQNYWLGSTFPLFDEVSAYLVEH